MWLYKPEEGNFTGVGVIRVGKVLECGSFGLRGMKRYPCSSDRMRTDRSWKSSAIQYFFLILVNTQDWRC